MNLATLMSEMGTALDTITGLRVFTYPPDDVPVPAAIVTYPDEITLDATYDRGVDDTTIGVVVVEGQVSDRATAARLAAYCNGSGARSVKAVLEAGTYTQGVTLRVVRVMFEVVTLAGVDRIAATFEVDVSGDGE